MYWDYRDKNDKKKARILGIVILAVLTIVVYIVFGYLASTESFFDAYGVGIAMGEKDFFVYVIGQSLSVLVPCIVYGIKFGTVADRKKTEWEFGTAKGDNTKPPVFKGWFVTMLITNLATIVVAALPLFLGSFKMVYGDLVGAWWFTPMIQHNTLFAWLIQCVIGLAVTNLKPFKPLEAKN